MANSTSLIIAPDAGKLLSRYQDELFTALGSLALAIQILNDTDEGDTFHDHIWNSLRGVERTVTDVALKLDPDEIRLALKRNGVTHE